jgi:hypothetical protein
MACPDVSNSPMAVAPSNPRTDQKTGGLDVFIIRFSPVLDITFFLFAILALLTHRASESASKITFG